MSLSKLSYYVETILFIQQSRSVEKGGLCQEESFIDSQSLMALIFFADKEKYDSHPKNKHTRTLFEISSEGSYRSNQTIVSVSFEDLSHTMKHRVF